MDDDPSLPLSFTTVCHTIHAVNGTRDRHLVLIAAVMASIMAVTLAAGCGDGVGAYRPSIQSEDAHERILAIRAAADSQDHSAIPLIVDRLEDDDEAVQIFAFIALNKITGERMGYELGQDDRAREQAIERWRDYVRRGDHKITMKQKTKPAGESAPRATASGT
jgi:hypothetical protein